MPRLPRIELPHVPKHIVQRGNDRRTCFFQPINRIRYLDELRDIARRAGCAVHAYVLMSNHVHLLVTPTAARQMAHVMQCLRRRYVRYVNDRYHRTGTLWEGRYKASPVAGDEHLLRCYRYIELNPVRAARVGNPADYEHSSFRANSSGQDNSLITPHATYLELGFSAPTRQDAYARFMQAGISDDELQNIRERIQRQHADGSDRSHRMIKTGVRVDFSDGAARHFRADEYGRSIDDGPPKESTHATSPANRHSPPSAARRAARQ